MADAMRISASGMQAAFQTLSSVAANLANANSNGPVPSTPPTQAVAPTAGSVYQPTTSIQTTAPGGGVTTSLQPSLPSYNLAYDPQSPYANMQGMIATPNVDIASQIVAKIEAVNSFRANLAVYKTASRLYKSLLDIA
ncbi:MAG TPA: flagellar basal body rod C-terminal domain-containing protein [Rhizomicrobium sp.]|nr:flagellar basal body rod C-terminal domain-containing protein [Rhizomicrobium sp.]